MIGTVKFWNEAKGFGFLTPEGAQRGERDIFVHVSGLADGRKSLTIGQPVTYEVETSQKGPRAVSVAVVG